MLGVRGAVRGPAGRSRAQDAAPVRFNVLLKRNKLFWPSLFGFRKGDRGEARHLETLAVR